VTDFHWTGTDPIHSDRSWSRVRTKIGAFSIQNLSKLLLKLLTELELPATTCTGKLFHIFMILWVKTYLRISYLVKFLIVAVSDGDSNLLSWANLSLADLAYLRLGYHQDGTRAPSARVPSTLDGTGADGARVPSWRYGSHWIIKFQEYIKESLNSKSIPGVFQEDHNYRSFPGTLDPWYYIDLVDTVTATSAHPTRTRSTDALTTTKEYMAVVKYITAMTITNMQHIRTQKDL